MRGSLSTLTSAMIVFVALTSVLTYISLELREAPTQVARLNYEVLNQISTSSKDVEPIVGEDGLYIRCTNPPVKLISVLEVGDGGVNTLAANLTISKTYEKVLDRGKLYDALLRKSYVVMLVEGGKYFIIGDEFLKNSTVKDSTDVNSVNTQYLNATNYLRPILYVGILKDLNSYMDNPVPGLPSDPEANYLPVGYALITGNTHTISKGDWYIYADPRSVPYKVGHVYGSGWTNISYLGMGYYRVDSNHYVYVKWYESVSGSTSGWYISYETLMTGTAGLWAYPLVMSGDRTVNLCFEIKNLGSWVNLNLRPFIYVLRPEDYVRGLPIMPRHTNPTLEAPIRYSVIKPLHSWEGSTEARGLGTNSVATVSVVLNTQPILKSLNVSEFLALVGFRFASTGALSIRLTTYVLDRGVEVDLSGDEVGKYVFLPASPNVVPEITSPSGSEVSVFRPSNLVSSLLDYPAFFIPQVSGTYVIKYKLAPYTSLPQLDLRVDLGGGNYSPVVEYLRNQHLGGWRVVVGDSISLEPNQATLKDFEYFTAGSETWYSGDLIRVDGIPINTQLNFTYYITASLQGVTTLTTGQNRSVDYNYWRVQFTYYPQGSATKLHVSGEVLYPSGYCYLRFAVTVKLADSSVTATPQARGTKYVYRYAGSTYLTLVTPQYSELVRIDNNALVLRG